MIPEARGRPRRRSARRSRTIGARRGTQALAASVRPRPPGRPAGPGPGRGRRARGVLPRHPDQPDARRPRDRRACRVTGSRRYRDVPVDAIPDISENQVVVYTPWPGRSPKDVEDQVTYPLAVALQGIPRVVDVRSISGFGFSQIYVVFEDGTDIYWARTRVLERLNVAQRDLPEGVTSGARARRDQPRTDLLVHGRVRDGGARPGRAAHPPGLDRPLRAADRSRRRRGGLRRRASSRSTRSTWIPIACARTA